MAIDMGGRPNVMPPQGPTADKVTITRAQGGGYAVECQRAEGVETSTFPDVNAALDYTASELEGGAPEAPPMDPMAPPPPMPEEMV